MNRQDARRSKGVRSNSRKLVGILSGANESAIAFPNLLRTPDSMPIARRADADDTLRKASRRRTALQMAVSCESSEAGCPRRRERKTGICLKLCRYRADNGKTPRTAAAQVMQQSVQHIAVAARDEVSRHRRGV
ncbi:hypothetical protein GCM10027343_00840 [Noviherbaspirillum agri]